MCHQSSRDAWPRLPPRLGGVAPAGAPTPKGVGRRARNGLRLSVSDRETQAVTAAPNAAWAPLRRPLFRALWTSDVVSSIGTWMHDAAAAWLMTLLTHFAFRRFHKRQGLPYLQLGPPGPWASLIGLGAVLAVLVSTWWVPGFRITLQAGLPWLGFVTVCYFVWRKARPRSSPGGESFDG